MILEFIKAKRLAAMAAVVAAISFSAFSVAYAAQVDVVGGTVPVAVESFVGENASEAANVLRGDLKRTSLISPVTQADRYVASASIMGDGLQGQLHDRISNTTVLNKTYTGGWRRAVHEFADDITLKVTGVPGFATNRVAFISNRTGKKELYTMDIDGANVVQRTQDGSISNAPAWSRDGKWLAYTSYKGGYPDIYLINLQAGTRKRVAYFPGLNTGAAFSPDGTSLALTLSKDGNPELYTMPVNGGEPQRLTRTRGAETSPTWSPDGLQLAFVSDDRGSPQLYTLPTTGGKPERLPAMCNYATEPDWSPDGKKIAMTVRLGGEFQIATLDLPTRKIAQVGGSTGEDPSWTSNSRHVVYSHQGMLYVLDTVSGQRAKIESAVTGCTEPAVLR